MATTAPHHKANDTFGGPVHMPTMTRLAETGVAFNSFHTTSMCSPTRASLITGRNHHNAGSGVVTEIASDFDGYVGEIPRSTATVARVLSDYGYSTAHFGKWHNTPPTHLSPRSRRSASLQAACCQYSPSQSLHQKVSVL